MEFQRQFCERTWEKEINPKIRLSEDLLERSFELDVEMWVGLVEVDVGKWRKEDKGIPSRRITVENNEGVIWRITFEGLSFSHDPYLVLNHDLYLVLNHDLQGFTGQLVNLWNLANVIQGEKGRICLSLVACSGHMCWWSSLRDWEGTN